MFLKLGVTIHFQIMKSIYRSEPVLQITEKSRIETGKQAPPRVESQYCVRVCVCVCVLRVLDCDVKPISFYKKCLQVTIFDLHQELSQERAV